eukprot:gi/632949242/ref/XP_007890037.1/ PREDICTED: GRAM domain-containing protein 1C [Callorhinchus milii]
MEEEEEWMEVESCTADPTAPDQQPNNLSSHNQDSEKTRLANTHDWSTDWNFWLVYPTYKQRNDEFKKQFKELPESESLIEDYACALQKDILCQGRLYLSENWLCFHSNIFRWETSITFALKDIISMTKAKMARLIPNAIQICTTTEKLYFTSFTARERTYLNIFRMWQNALLDKYLSKKELLGMVQQNYGTDLGLNKNEMDSLQLSSDEAHLIGSSGKNTNDEYNDKRDHSNKSRMFYPEAATYHSSTPLPTGDASFVIPSVVINDDEPGMLPRVETRGEISLIRRSFTTSEKENSRGGSNSSSSWLDLNGNEDLPTERNDLSDAVDEDTAEDEFYHDMKGRLYVNRVFNMSADKIFELLFTDSEFLQNFTEARKITEFVSSPWEEELDGNQKRTLKYKITITNPLAGKFSTGTETQILYKKSQKEHYYLIDSEIITHDVPYHDYFYTLNRFCIIQTSKRKCRLRVSSDICYRKQPWGLVKIFIEKHSWSGLEEYFKHLESSLLVEEILQNKISSELGQVGMVRRRRRAYSRSQDQLVKQLSSRNLNVDSRDVYAGKLNDVEDKSIIWTWNLSKFVLIMSIILVILALLNISLFFKLLVIEDVAQKAYFSNRTKTEKHKIGLDPEIMSPKEITKHKNKADLQRLQGVIKDSILLLDQLKGSLSNIQKSFDLQNQTIKIPT